MEFEFRRTIPLDLVEFRCSSSVLYVENNVASFLAKRQSGRLVGDMSIDEFREMLSSSLGGSVPSVSAQTSSSANASVSDPAVISAVSPIAVANSVGVDAALPSVIPAVSPAAVPAVSPCSPVVVLSSEGDVVASSSSTGVVGSSPDVLSGGKGRFQKRDGAGK